MLWDENEALRQYDEPNWSIWTKLREVANLWGRPHAASTGALTAPRDQKASR